MKTRVQSLFGEVLKTFGTNGELFVKLSDLVSDNIKMEEPVFVVMDGLQVPFFVSRFEPRGRKAVMVFDDMDTETLASELVGKKIMFYAKGKPDKPSDHFELLSLVGYSITDIQCGSLGTITDFYDYPGNPCLAIQYNDKEILIPIHEELIREIDEKQRCIISQIPEGLLDL